MIVIDTKEKLEEFIVEEYSFLSKTIVEESKQKTLPIFFDFIDGEYKLLSNTEAIEVLNDYIENKDNLIKKVKKDVKSKLKLIENEYIEALNLLEILR